MGKLLNVSLGLLVSSVYLCSLFDGTSAVSETEDLAVTPEQKQILESVKYVFKLNINDDYNDFFRQTCLPTSFICTV